MRIDGHVASYEIFRAVLDREGEGARMEIGISGCD